ncbi:MAG: methyltransferase domain-containing protein [Planctomycetales bacterium]|nr:methyltransferase domain-containing protein [Planctomycetales bacterium]
MKRAAGFVLSAGEGQGRRFLVLRNARHGTWGLPKGHRREGEGEMAGAVRETAEETGLWDFDPLPDFRREVSYRLPSGEEKCAVYFLARAAAPSHRLSAEHDAGEWLPAAAAGDRLGFPEMRALLEAALARLSRGEGPLVLRRQPQSCPLCGDEDGATWLRLRADPGRLAGLCGRSGAAPSAEDEYRRCRSCGLLHLAEVLEEDLWHAFTFAPPDPGKHARDRAAIERMARADSARARALAPGPRLLEVGCGYGYGVAAARALGLEAEGLDLAARKLRHAREACGVPAEALRLGDPCGADLPGGRYHAILALHVLEHLPAPVEALRRLRTALAPGGLLLLATPNARSWRARLEGAAWPYATPFGHLALYEPATLREALHRAGFGAVRRLPRLGVEGPLASALKIILYTVFPDSHSELCVAARPH